MEKQVLESLIQEDFSQRKMAEKLGVSQATIKHWLKKYGLKTNKLLYNVYREEKISAKCYKCKVEKSIDNFPKKRRNGKITNCAECYECFYARLYKQRVLKKKSMIEYKGGSCQKCGYDKCDEVLEFHHINPAEKEFNMGKYNTKKADDELWKELDKCILLCANCHREMHYEIKQKSLDKDAGNA